MKIFDRLKGFFVKPTNNSIVCSDGIKVGDLVWMAYGHKCSMNAGYGIPFIVTRTVYSDVGDRWRCEACGELFPQELAAYGCHAVNPIPLSWLKKYDPPGELEDVETTLDEPSKVKA